MGGEEQLEANGSAIATWVGDTFYGSIRVTQKRACVAHNLSIRTDHLDIMSGSAECLVYALVEAVLDSQIGRFRTPGAPKQPARIVNRLRQVLPKMGITRLDHRLGLRLTLTAHGAIAHHPSVVELRERRLYGVEGAAVGLQRVYRRVVQTETGTPFLPKHTAFREHKAGTKLPIEALIEAHRGRVRRSNAPSILEIAHRCDQVGCKETVPVHTAPPLTNYL